jgi:hypothetical protein
METTPATGEPRRPSGNRVALTLLGTVLFLMSSDRLIDAWSSGSTARVIFYGLTSVLALVAVCGLLFRTDRS